MEKPLEAAELVVEERAVVMNLAGAGGVGPAGEEGLMQALPWQSCSPSGSPGVGCVWTQCSSPSSLHSHSQGQGSSSWSGSLEEEERELELLLEDELELEELDDEELLLELEELDELDEEELELLEELDEEEELELLLEDELEEDEELELLEEELEDGALLEESGSWGGKELLWKLEDDQLLEEDDEEELELLEEELELLLGLGSNSNESPPPAELLDESPSSISWYRLTRVSTVSPSLSAGVFSASR